MRKRNLELMDISMFGWLATILKHLGVTIYRSLSIFGKINSILLQEKLPQIPFLHSLSSIQDSPSHFSGHDPPQSMPVSQPFLTLSEHVGATVNYSYIKSFWSIGVYLSMFSRNYKLHSSNLSLEDTFFHCNSSYTEYRNQSLLHHRFSLHHYN